MEFIVLSIGYLQSNTIIAYDTNTRDSIIIDPSNKIDKIIKEVNKKSLNVKHVLYTHGHFDHIDPSGELQRVYNCSASLHPDDFELYYKVNDQRKMFGYSQLKLKSIAKVESHSKDNMISFGSIKGKIIHTPGHSKGSCCFLFGDTLASGDTLFRNGVGRTDLPGGSSSELKTSLNYLFHNLPLKTRVIPGHGGETTIEKEIDRDL
ncbi:putative Beta-lactamase-like protein [Monocercomonoides exilis]|uniref:putative Beta-lactamase-like protein n=1 Tax=Monocercomonoides exilis TaxID=2049356 RepID=UPI00355967CC|nr:putative Beta-lactamase-like protein [Monocercomonoides exilis]|eukprot:MONOS_15324.1-p1 / transcript=MONOS_15324.1 / gene=MONOS_15324 / organism=Monocercomonoides_exilis_PA203 / gene_product=Beta-lactamase-like protein / transcript_product=Beta-lactamase-like protein / location=Mono_scaffold01198:6946-8008(-) / protein_length=205 / sequence_SO=supercontig / SO=protein_coding / is_pseudo=false